MKVTLKPEKPPVADVMCGRYSHTRGSKFKGFSVSRPNQWPNLLSQRYPRVLSPEQTEPFFLGVHVKGHND